MAQKSNIKIPWHWLECFLVAAESGSIRKASERLQVNHSTVARQLTQLETLLEKPVLARYRQGLRLTPFGEELLHHVQGMQASYDQLDIFIRHANDELAGPVSITLGDSLLPALLPVLKNLKEQYPQLEFDLAISNQLARLEQGEADIALRITQQPPEDMIGHFIGHLPLYAYVSQSLFQQSGYSRPEDYPLVTWRSRSASSASLDPIRQHFALQPVACRVDSSAALLDAVKAGLGVGFMLACFADNEPELQKMNLPEPPPTLPLWLLYHPQHRRSSKIHTIVSSIREGFKNLAIHN